MVRTVGKPVFSIRWIVAGTAAVLTTLAVLGVTGVMERRTRNVLADEIETRLLLEARNLALASSSALLTDYPELVLAPLLKEMQARQRELAMIVVLDRSGIIQGHPDVRRIGTRFARPNGLQRIPFPAPRRRNESLEGNGTILLVSAPILDADGRILGTALVGMNRSHIEQAINQIGKQQPLILVAFLLTGFAASFFLMSILLRPIATLRSGIERIGRGDLSTPVKLADKTEFGLLAEAVNEMSSALRRAQGEMVERARLAHEMELARQIQRSLLPSKPTVAGEFIISGEQWAAAEVGGDYFDVLSLPDGKIALAVADVSGKGLAGCLVTSMIFSLLRAYHSTHPSPASLLAALDERLGEILQRGNFVTMFYGVLDPESGRLVYSSAGHNPTLVYRRDAERVEWLRSKGIPLGAIRGGAIRGTLEDSVLHLATGDVLVQFTDGLNETVTPKDQEQFGFERMERVVLDAARAGAREVLDRLHGTVGGWRGDALPMDDETVLIVSRENAPDPERLIATRAGDSVSDAAAALRRFALAEERGTCLRLQADFDALNRVDEWLEQSEILRGLPNSAVEMLNLALYEACANVVEHGYDEDATQTFELWWISGSGNGITSPRGSFLIRDQGKPFRPESWKPTNFRNPAARKRGRGLGLDIIYRTMREVAYHPGTELGNITVLDWDPLMIRTREPEARHVSQ